MLSRDSFPEAHLALCCCSRQMRIKRSSKPQHHPMQHRTSGRTCEVRNAAPALPPLCCPAPVYVQHHSGIKQHKHVLSPAAGCAATAAAQSPEQRYTAPLSLQPQITNISAADSHIHAAFCAHHRTTSSTTHMPQPPLPPAHLLTITSLFTFTSPPPHPPHHHLSPHPAPPHLHRR